MPKSTPKGIQHPVAQDYIKHPSTPSKLAQDLQIMATTTDAAIGTEGARAQQAATQAAINDANSKYGGLPGRVNHVEAHNTTQDTQINNQNTRLWAVERLGGLAPGDVSDATMTSIAANPDSTFHEQQSEQISSGAGVINLDAYPNLAAAVHAANTTGRALVIDRDFVDASVPREFFNIPVVGKGTITVGGNKWWVNPHHLGIQTNRLYIDPTDGSDSNAGIDPNAPIKSFNRLNIVLSMLREKLLDGFWEVIIKEGTHQLDQGWSMDGLRTKWPLLITGESDKATTLDGSNDTLGKAFLFKHFQTSVNFRNLRIQNYVGGSSNDGIDTSAGILCHGPGRASFRDIDITDCTTGISVGYGITAAFQNCSVEGSEARSLNSTVSTGITILYGASATVGSSGGLGNTFRKCGTAVRVSRNSVAHVDFNTFEDNYYGIQASHNARIAIIDGTANRNMIAVQLSGGAECTYSTMQYGVGEHANLLYNMRMGGTSRLSSYQGAATSAVEYRLESIVYPDRQDTPSNTTRNSIITFSSASAIPADTLVGAGKKIRVVLYARANSTNGQRRFELSKNDRDGNNREFLGGITTHSTVGEYHFQVEIIAETTDEPGTFVWNSTVSAYNYNLHSSSVVRGLDLSHDWRIRVYQENLSDPTDTINITKAELYVTG